MAPSKRRRAVICGGLRTPFARAFSELADFNAVSLGAHVVRALLSNFALPTRELGLVTFGNVHVSPTAPNVAREIALAENLYHVDTTTCSKSAASGLEAIRLAVSAIERGECDTAIAGGVESSSQLPLTFAPHVSKALAPLMTTRAQKPLGLIELCSAIGNLLPQSNLLPSLPKSQEPSTGELLGVAAESIAERNSITREAQDEFAVRSHTRAAKAVAEGKIAKEIVPLARENGNHIYTDSLICPDITVRDLAAFRPAFVHQGTVTAGNSAAAADGAAAVLLMEESKARSLGYTPLAAFKAFAGAAADPSDQGFVALAYSVEKALRRNKLELKDFTTIEFHESFAVQVLATIKLLKSDAFAKSHLNRAHAVGEIDPEQLNPTGGCIAFGDPEGASGVRCVLRAISELEAGQLSLLALNGQGGIGLSAILEAL